MEAIGLKVNRQIWSIQYLRALAAISVIVFHLLFSLPFAWLGEHGVDLFFVISGFMMVLMTMNKEITPIHFIVDRVTRIVPLYWMATCLVVVAALIGIELFASSIDYTLLIKSLFFLPAYSGQGRIWPTLYLGWTLNYEMFFYALYALCLNAPQKVRTLSLFVILVILVSVGVVFQPCDAVLRTWTSPLLLEFVAGTWLGTVYGLHGSRYMPLQMFALMTGVGILLLIISTIEPRLVFGAFSVVIVAVGLLVEKLERLPRINFLKRLGDASYSIYLFQGFAFAGTGYILSGATALTGWKLDLIRFSAPLGIVSAIALGYAVSLLIERPVTGWMRHRAARLLQSQSNLG